MGIGRAVHWAEHITTTQLAECFGVRESSSILLSLSRLRWLGHVALMPDDRCLDGCQRRDQLKV